MSERIVLVRKSRWVKNSGVPRYDKRTETEFLSTFVEEHGWRFGARVVKRGR